MPMREPLNIPEALIAHPPQSVLPLDAPPLSPGTPLLPARMVNEYTYCPRLAYLEWVQGEWAESADTVEGRYSHKRVDRPAASRPRRGRKRKKMASRFPGLRAPASLKLSPSIERGDRCPRSSCFVDIRS